MTVTPIDLFDSFIHLDRCGRVRAVQPEFDPERDRADSKSSGGGDEAGHGIMTIAAIGRHTTTELL